MNEIVIEENEIMVKHDDEEDETDYGYANKDFKDYGYVRFALVSNNVAIGDIHKPWCVNLSASDCDAISKKLAEFSNRMQGEEGANRLALYESEVREALKGVEL